MISCETITSYSNEAVDRTHSTLSQNHNLKPLEFGFNKEHIVENQPICWRDAVEGDERNYYLGDFTPSFDKIVDPKEDYDSLIDWQDEEDFQEKESNGPIHVLNIEDKKTV